VIPHIHGQAAQIDKLFVRSSGSTTLPLINGSIKVALRHQGSLGFFGFFQETSCSLYRGISDKTANASTLNICSFIDKLSFVSGEVNKRLAA
jgi:hypothetical protein